jgi:glucose-1-phosphate thymidylyltransferase
MKAIILAAGYATRLYPITKNFPKPLLCIGDKEILTHIIEKLEVIKDIDDVYVVCNDKFHKYFEYWQDQVKTRLNISIINDGTSTIETALGAIGDLYFAMESKKINDDIFVLAADTLTEFDFNKFINMFHAKNSPVVGSYSVSSLEEAKRYGNISIDSSGKIISFEEKPTEPKSKLVTAPFYVYPKKDLAEIRRYVKEGNNIVNIGNLIAHFHKLGEYYALPIDKDIYDIGTVELYNKINQQWGAKR